MKIVFIVSFLVFISLPLLFLDTKSVVSEQENRNLASFPQFIEEGKINIDTIKKSPRLFDAYLNDRFGFRNQAVSLATPFNKSSNRLGSPAVFGKDDWLFYNGNNNPFDFFKINLFTDNEIKQFITNIEKRLDWCIDNNIKFVLLIPPNKHNVYPEYYPFERPGGITRTEQVMMSLPDRLKNVVIYPLDHIVQYKTSTMPLYFETDTHWNMIGAQYVFELLFNHIKDMFPNADFPELQFTTDISYDSTGDIAQIVGYTSYGKRTIPEVYPVEGWDYFYHYIKNEGVYGEDGVVIQNKDESLPKAIIYRDSFFIALEPFTSATLFSAVEYNWRWFTEVEKEYILQNKPDIIIWEVLERFIEDLPNSGWN